MKRMQYVFIAGVVLLATAAGCGKAGTEADAKADLEKIMGIFVG